MGFRSGAATAQADFVLDGEDRPPRVAEHRSPRWRAPYSSIERRIAHGTNGSQSTEGTKPWPGLS